jgi:hypothetical protein
MKQLLKPCISNIANMSKKKPHVISGVMMVATL